MKISPSLIRLRLKWNETIAQVQPYENMSDSLKKWGNETNFEFKLVLCSIRTTPTKEI